MRHDATSLSTSRVQATDIAIIGSGPVGLLLARELADSGRTVRLIESGEEAYTRSLLQAPRVLHQHVRGAQQFSSGELSGEPYYHLRLSRARAVGGSSHVWRPHGLRARDLDAIDFDPRGLPGLDGWPLEQADLAPYYRRARAAIGLPTDGEFTLGPGHVPSLPDGVEVAIFHHAQPAVFTAMARELDASEGVELLFNATVTEIGASATSEPVELTLQTLQGQTFRTACRRLVIAGGGIENARILLLMKEAGASLSQQVGTHFMEHFHSPVGYIRSRDPLPFADLLEPAEGPGSPQGALALSPELRGRESLAGMFMHLTSTTPLLATAGFESARHVRRLLHHGLVGRSLLEHAAAAAIGLPRGWLTAERQGSAYVINVQAEQLPFACSRVTLSERRDRFGLPKARLEWRRRREDLPLLERAVDRVGQLLGDAGLGTVERTLGRRWPATPIYGGWHHMGTTRMAHSPDNGAVDPTAAVFGLDGVYVAGSSLFPTGGGVNPTLTALALAIRLADHLKAA